MNDRSEGSSVFTSYVDQSCKSFNEQIFEEKFPHALPDIAELDEFIKLRDHKRIKKLLRINPWSPDHEVRRNLWWKLCCVGHGRTQLHSGTLYSEITREVYGEGDADSYVRLPSFVDPCHLESYYLTDAGISTAKKLLSIISHERPDIVFCPLLYGLTCLLLHYLDEQSCYDCINYIISSKEKFIAQTKTAHEASVLVLKELTRKYAKPSFQNLVKKTPDVELVLENWSWWIMKDLPFAYLVRVVDCYLFEGPKVLYRVALAILIQYHKQIVKTSPKRGGGDADIVREMRQFCENIPISSCKLLKTAFGIRGLSRSELKKLILRKEIFVQSKHNVALLQGTMPTSPSAGSLSLLVTKDTGSHLLTKQEHLDVVHRQRSCSHDESYCSSFHNIRSTVLGSEEWRDIYSWLPKRFTLKQPKLIFSTSEHGTSLSTFYSRVEGHEPTFIAIKTNRQEIFGAYCSVDWIERKNGKQNFFGTGESFICLLHPTRIRYPWVGISLKEETPNSAHLFLCGSGTQICIGGGNGVAILLDENLLKGSTQRCDTFGNPPLVTGEFFTVTVLETFCFE